MADDHIIGGERRVAAQKLLVERLRSAPGETNSAETLLGNLQDMLQAWHDHRAIIVRKIAELEHPTFR